MSKIRNHYMPDNIVGPVTQSGGIPTGAIVESGTGTNGRYVRWADGTQHCYMQVVFTANSQNNAGTIIDFPKAFINSADIRMVGSARGTASASLTASYIVECGPISTTQFKGKILVHTATTIADISASMPVEFIAYGRWF